MKSKSTAVWRWVTVALLSVTALVMATRYLTRNSYRAPTTPHNVLLISIDTLRADHVGALGGRAATPNLDRLAAGGALFTQCISSCPMTLPSHTSMLTGTYPYVHAARANGSFHVAPENLTLPEVLRDAGYATAAVVGAFVLNREFGLDQGFDVYDDIRGESQALPEESERRGDAVTASAVRLLREASARGRFFLFVHYFDPHFPYEAPEPYRSAAPTLYEGELAFVDAQVGLLLGELARLGEAERTLVILTSDHGEGLGDHGEDSHGNFLYDSTLHVPLILRCPGVIPRGRRVDQQVRLIDIAPTVLEFAGGLSMPDIQGRSLLPLLAGKEVDARPAYAETLGPMLDFQFFPLRALRDDGWKYIHSKRPQLYHVADDAREQHDLTAEQPQRLKALYDALRQMLQGAPKAGLRGQRQMADRELERIKALGYLGGSEGPALSADAGEMALFEPDLPDIDEHREQVRQTLRVMSLMQQQRFDEAERLLIELRAASHDPQRAHWACKTLAFLLSRFGRHAEALPYYAQALATRRDDGTTLGNYAASLAEVGQTEAALDMFAAAAQVPPVLSRTRCNYAVALTRVGRVEEALAQLQLALEVAPDDIDALLARARIQLAAERPQAALAGLQQALERVPRSAPLRMALASAHMQMGEVADARNALELVLTHYPAYAPAQLQLAQVLIAQGDSSQAETILRESVQREPGFIAGWHALAFVQLQAGRSLDAVASMRSGLAVNENHVSLLNDLAWLLATSPEDAVRNGAEAVRLAERARDLTGGKEPKVLGTLAGALAEAGRFDDAVATSDEAIRIAQATGGSAALANLERQRQHYRERKPFRIEPMAPR
jgi:arylsulfatase A-like enzyme/Tfp pilus assembly protein PilF